MAITELKKNGSKKEIQTRCKALRALGVARACFELLGYLLAALGFVVGYLLAIALLKFETLSANVPDRTR